MAVMWRRKVLTTRVKSPSDGFVHGVEGSAGADELAGQATEAFDKLLISTLDAA